MDFKKLLKKLETSPEKKAKILVTIENPSMFEAWLNEIFEDEQLAFIPGCLIYAIEAGDRDKILSLHSSYFHYIKEALDDLQASMDENEIQDSLGILSYEQWLRCGKPQYGESYEKKIT